MPTEERRLYLNGEILEESRARLSPFDRGFLWGDGVYEITPCFNGKAFRLEDHLDRLYRSLRYVQIEPPISREEMEGASNSVLAANSALLDSSPICKLGHWITRGEDQLGTSTPHSGATVCIICWPASSNEVRGEDFRKGVKLVVVATRRNPPESLDPKAKVISKMNQILAELDAKALDALPLMLDTRGFVAESSIANFYIVRDGVVWTPTGRNILHGITRKVLLEFADRLGMKVIETDFTMYDVGQAEEFFLTHSSVCVMPVRQVDRYTPTAEVPGPVTTLLMKAFAEETGIDFLAIK